jgi:adenylate cyclase
MGADKEGTLEGPKALRRELLDPKIAEHHGRIPGLEPGTKTTGDCLLVEFASVVDAVRCAGRAAARADGAQLCAGAEPALSER